MTRFSSSLATIMGQGTEELEIVRDEATDNCRDTTDPTSGMTSLGTESHSELDDLQQTLDPRRAVTLLAELGMTDSDIATAVGATDRTVRRWRSADGTSVRRYWRQIDDLRALVGLMRDEGTLPDANIVYWLRARNRHLADQRPLDRLREGGFEDVRAAALALLQN